VNTSRHSARAVGETGGIRPPASPASGTSVAPLASAELASTNATRTIACATAIGIITRIRPKRSISRPCIGADAALANA
jgi:hypothetical protein